MRSGGVLYIYDVLLCLLILVNLFIEINDQFSFIPRYTLDILYFSFCTNLVHHNSTQLVVKVHSESISLTHSLLS